jgi:hypothetical protein
MQSEYLNTEPRTTSPTKYGPSSPMPARTKKTSSHTLKAGFYGPVIILVKFLAFSIWRNYSLHRLRRHSRLHTCPCRAASFLDLSLRAICLVASQIDSFMLCLIGFLLQGSVDGFQLVYGLECSSGFKRTIMMWNKYSYLPEWARVVMLGDDRRTQNSMSRIGYCPFFQIWRALRMKDRPESWIYARIVWNLPRLKWGIILSYI